MNQLIKVKNLPAPPLPPTKPAWTKPVIEYPEDARILTFYHEIPESKKPKPRKQEKPKPKKKAPEPKQKRTQSGRPYQPWTESDIKKLIRLYQKGASFQEISEKVGHTECSTNVKITALRKEGRITVIRRQVGWTREMDETLLRMRAEGATYSAIGKAVGKTESAAWSRLRKLERKVKRDEE